MKKALFITLLLTLGLTSLAIAFGYNYVNQDDFKKWLESGKNMAIVDIQPAADFKKQHFKGAIETNAFPAKTAEERARLDKTLPQFTATANDIVIICPRGGSGAKNTYDYLKNRGIAEKRLFILESGMQGWPHRGLTVAGS